MAIASTLTTVRRTVGEELGPDVMIYGNISALAVTSLTSLIFINTNWGSGHLSGKNTVLHRLGATDSGDYYRYAGALTNSSGLVAVAGGANYADTTATSEVVEAWYYGVRHDQHILPAINRALSYNTYQTFVAISHGGDLDYDMALSTDSNWTDVGTPTTSAKSTTARRTPWGLRSYQLIGDAVNEGTRGATLGVNLGSRITLHTISSANVGEASFQPYDITGSAAIGTAITHSQEEPQLMTWTGNVPSTCKEAAPYMLGTTNPSDIFWNQVWFYKHDNLRLNLPAYINEEYKLPSLFIGIPRVSTGTGTWDGQALDFEELKEGRDYRYFTGQSDANPHAVSMANDSYYQYPIFALVNVPYPSLSAESDTTTCPLHLITPRVRIELLDSVYKAKLPADLWGHLRQKAQLQVDESTKARPRSQVADKVSPYPARYRVMS